MESRNRDAGRGVYRVALDASVLINFLILERSDILGRILTTPGILLRAIRSNILGVAEADELKVVLERNRFRMTFDSFADHLP